MGDALEILLEIRRMPDSTRRPVDTANRVVLTHQVRRVEHPLFSDLNIAEATRRRAHEGCAAKAPLIASPSGPEAWS